jgi:hypothetical protein
LGGTTSCALAVAAPARTSTSNGAAVTNRREKPAIIGFPRRAVDMIESPVTKESVQNLLLALYDPRKSPVKPFSRSATRTL